MFDLIIQQARICDGTGKPSFVGTLGVTGCLARDVGDGHAPGLQRVIEHWGRGCPEECQEPGVLIQYMAAMTAARGTLHRVVAHLYL